jgi:hypothetical protein
MTLLDKGDTDSRIRQGWVGAGARAVRTYVGGVPYQFQVCVSEEALAVKKPHNVVAAFHKLNVHSLAKDVVEDGVVQEPGSQLRAAHFGLVEHAAFARVHRFAVRVWGDRVDHLKNFTEATKAQL